MGTILINGKIYTFVDTKDPEVIYIDAKDLKRLYDGITIGRLKKHLKCDSYEDALELLRHMFRYYISINNIVLASAVFKYAYFMHIRVYEGYRMGLKPMMELFDRLKFCHSGSRKYNGHYRYSIDEWTLYLEKSGKKSTHSPERMMHEATDAKVEKYMQSMDLDIEEHMQSMDSDLGDDTVDKGIDELEIPELEYDVYEGINDYEIPELDED